jgi:hypothetical protein
MVAGNRKIQVRRVGIDQGKINLEEASRGVILADFFHCDHPISRTPQVDPTRDDQGHLTEL